MRVLVLTNRELYQKLFSRPELELLQFLDRLQKERPTFPLLNSDEVLRWNMDKSYLGDLRRQGVPRHTDYLPKSESPLAPWVWPEDEVTLTTDVNNGDSGGGSSSGGHTVASSSSSSSTPPSALSERACQLTLERVWLQFGWNHVVAKPNVSANSDNTAECWLSEPASVAPAAKLALGSLQRSW